MQALKTFIILTLIAYAVGVFIWWRSAYLPLPQGATAAMESPVHIYLPPLRPPMVAGKTFKVLQVKSYDTQWSAAQLEAFEQELGDMNVEYRVVELDANRNDTTEKLQPRVDEAQRIIAEWNPDLVYATDDVALDSVVRKYAGSQTQFVFSGVNRDAGYYGLEGARNITGVLEREHIVQAAQVFSAIAPDAKRLAIISDDEEIWPAVIDRIKDVEAELPLKIVAIDIVQTYQEYQQRMHQYRETADAVLTLGMSGFKDENGQNVAFEEAAQWTYENVKLPQISFWDERARAGALCVVSVPAQMQGQAAGQIARGILIDGKAPANYPIDPTHVGRPVINTAAAKDLGLTVPASVLLGSEVIQIVDWTTE